MRLHGLLIGHQTTPCVEWYEVPWRDAGKASPGSEAYERMRESVARLSTSHLLRVAAQLSQGWSLRHAMASLERPHHADGKGGVVNRTVTDMSQYSAIVSQCKHKVQESAHYSRNRRAL